MLAQAEQCISDGAKVGIIVDHRHAARRSRSRRSSPPSGGKTIDYDRQIIGGTGSVYVTFDGNLVGRHAGAAAFIAGMKAKGDVRPERRGRAALGRPDGRERVLVQERQRRHPEPALQGEEGQEGPGEVRAALGSRTRPRRSSSRCSSRRATRSRASSPANDGIAGAVVATLKAKGLKPIPLSGQDATVQGVQNIISGWQTNTVYKYVPDEANAAAAAAVALFKGAKPKVERER